MKKIAILLITFLTIGLTNNFAQTETRDANVATSTNITTDAYLSAATTAASKDASIEKRTCKGSDKVCFFKTSKDDSGKMVSSEVKYDEATATFVSSKTSCSTTKSCCAGKKACCAKGAKTCSKDKNVQSDKKINN
ncbi:MAG: hypothetical protein ABIO44_00620 [Saprospiraceae bacterium]